MVRWLADNPKASRNVTTRERKIVLLDERWSPCFNHKGKLKRVSFAPLGGGVWSMWCSDIPSGNPEY